MMRVAWTYMVFAPAVLFGCDHRSGDQPVARHDAASALDGNTADSDAAASAHPVPERQKDVEIVVAEARSGGAIWRDRWLSADERGIWSASLEGGDSALLIPVANARLNLAVADDRVYWEADGASGADLWVAGLDERPPGQRRIARDLPRGGFLVSAGAHVWLLPDCRHASRFLRVTPTALADATGGGCGLMRAGDPVVRDDVLYGHDRDELLAYDLRRGVSSRQKLGASFEGLAARTADVLVVGRSSGHGIEVFSWPDPAVTPRSPVSITGFDNDNVARWAAGDGALYAATSYGWIYELPLDGSRAHYLAEAEDKSLIQLFVHDGALYWETSHGSLYRLRLAR